MNAMSAQLAQKSRKAGSALRVMLPAILAMTPLLGAVSPPSLAQAGDQPIVASLNPPPAGLACDAAAAATSVYFQFTRPPFQVSQISLYLDGRGVPQDAVDEQWPTVILDKGLHPGSNTIDIVANGSAGQQIQRRMVVQVGGVSDGSAGSAQVPCDDSAVAQQAPADQALPDQVPADADPQPVAVQDYPQQFYDAQPPLDYGDGYPPPVYFYSAYPLVAFGPWVPFVPFFGFGLFYAHYHPHFAPPRLVVNHRYYGPGYGGAQHFAPRPAHSYAVPSYHTSYSAPARQYRPAPQYRQALQYRAPPQRSFRASAAAVRAGGGRSAAASRASGERRR